MNGKKIRKNRFRKKVRDKEGRLLRRLASGVRLFGLVFALLTVSALFMVGYAAVTQSDYFRTQRIEVVGNQRLTKEEVIAQSGIRAGENVLAVNLSLVRKRLLAHAWVAAARVSREIPGTLRLVIKEHQSIAVIDLGRRFLINTQGRIFKEYEDGDPVQLPLVTGIDYLDISLGDDALGPAMTAVLDLLAISKDNKNALPYSALARVHYDAQIGVTVTDRRGDRSIRLGVGDFEKKVSRLALLTSHLSRDGRWRNFRSIDLNDPDRAVVGLTGQNG